jgi:hypothetical protein
MTTAHTVSRFSLGVFAALAMAAAGQAQAQITIDQNKALAGNITPNDSPGFPITLSLPGAYKLTSNLVVPANLSAVDMQAPGITLDLNGFNIGGPIVCTRNLATFVVSCTPSNVTTRGVISQAGGNTVRNGNVRGFSYGVNLISGDHLENMLVEHNGIAGVSSIIQHGGRSLIRQVRSQLNGDAGFDLANVMAQSCTAEGNGLDGFTGKDLIVLDSVSVNNRRFGFNAIGVGAAALIMGRSVAQSNQTANVSGVLSLGGNLNGTTVF